MKIKDLKLGEMFTVGYSHHVWVKIEGNILSLTTLKLSNFAPDDEIISQGYIDQTVDDIHGLRKYKYEYKIREVD
jgi:hypothetical protein